MPQGGKTTASNRRKVHSRANALLEGGSNEANIRNRLCRLLDVLNCDEYRLEYPTGGGRADIYLPRQRTIIETKAIGGAEAPAGGNESPSEQLDRYMQAEIGKVRESLFTNESDRSWTGILTDGRVWHSWSYVHRDNPSAQEEKQDFKPNSGRELAEWLGQELAGDPVSKPWIPANPAALFAEHAKSLRAVYNELTGRQAVETDTRLALWRDMLHSSGMEPQTDAARHSLFRTHSFLIALARGVVWTMEHPHEEPDPKTLLGDGIVSWIVQTTVGRQWAAGLFETICGFEWRQRRGDVLRPLYEAFVGSDDRKDFGEVYTPDWLAELVVNEVLDEDWCGRAFEAARGEIVNHQPLRGIGVLDPCCGSGTFLYHAARRLLDYPDISRQPSGRQADIVSRLVYGIDIHPVACEFARATLLRALPAEPPGGDAALRIWNGDSLLLHGAESQSLFAPQNGEVVFVSPAGSEVRLPEAFVTRPDFASLIKDMTGAAVQALPMPSHIEHSVQDDADQNQLRASHATLQEIIRNEGNSVWTWFMQQTVGPYLLARHKVDRIVSNPPWVKMATIQHQTRKRRLEAFARGMELWQGGIQAPHTDIAQLFIKRCREQYLQDHLNAPAAWVVKHSAIKGGNWEKFRAWRRGDGAEGKEQRHDLASTGQILDLAPAQVFGGGDAQKSCVLIDNMRTALGRDVPTLVAHCPSDRPNAGSTLQEANECIEWNVPEASLPEGESGYNGMFRNGATIFPHVLAIADRIAGDGETRTVTTRRSVQSPWKEVHPPDGEIPASWLAPLLRSEHLLPFVLAPEGPDSAIVPVDEEGQLLDEKAALAIHGWRELQDIYREFRGQGQSTPATLLERLDYQRNLSRQLPLVQAERVVPLTRVIYPVSGDIMRACRLPACADVVGHTIYHATFDAPEEAAYLVALLNAPALNPAFVQSRRSGRHFSLHPWRRVPIPRFDPGCRLHCEIAALCVEIEDETDAFLAAQQGNLPRSQIGRSKQIRQSGLFARLDDMARQLMPEQCP